LIRTVQRRVKIWREDMAPSLVFGAIGDAPPLMTSAALRNMGASPGRGHQESPEPAGLASKKPQEHWDEATT
jgi:hypothetical protein